MTQFTRPLDIRKVEGTKYWLLRAEVVYHVGSVDSGEVITAPVGFKTDLGSKPRLLWWLVGHPLDEGAQAYVIHDRLLEHPEGRTRRECDQIFLEGLKVLGVGWLKRTAMYSGVRVGSWRSWNKYRKAEKEARRIAEKCKEYNESSTPQT